MAKLTAKESKWLKEVQAVINKCPSNRIGFFTIGDNDIYAFDFTKIDEIMDDLNSGKGGDFCVSCNKTNALFDAQLEFPNPVESTQG